LYAQPPSRFCLFFQSVISKYCRRYGRQPVSGAGRMICLHKSHSRTAPQGGHRVYAPLAFRGFTFAAADNQKRQEKPRNYPKYRLNNCSIHRFVLLLLNFGSVFLFFAQPGSSCQPPNSRPGALPRFERR
jgi:hypothetical protein